MDSFATRFFGEADAVRITHWLQVAYAYVYNAYHTDVAFMVFGSVLLAGVLYLLFKASTMVASAVMSLVTTCWLGKRLRAFKGRREMRKRQRTNEERWIADKFLDLVENGVAEGKIDSKSVRYWYKKIAKNFDIPDLMPKERISKKLMKLKSRLKSKHADKVVVLAEARKERNKPKSLLGRFELARKKA